MPIEHSGFALHAARVGDGLIAAALAIGFEIAVMPRKKQHRGAPRSKVPAVPALIDMRRFFVARIEWKSAIQAVRAA
jgi:hypothetical protein